VIRGELYLIPTPLGNIDPLPTTPEQVRNTIARIEHYMAERPKSAVQFISRLGLGDRLDRMTFLTLDDRTPDEEILTMLKQTEKGRSVGILSEAGCPAIADPGAQPVRLAHALGIRVVPLVGPSSIALALMASGLNGQRFSFHGYLPAERNGRIEQIARLERDSRANGSTQIFIEAPHRNDHLIADLLQSCNPETQLCIATDLTTATEQVRTMTVGAWRKKPPSIGKRPTIFLLQR